jgi:hypothetical protein
MHMGLFAAFRGNKSWTGTITDKNISTSGDSEGEQTTRHWVVVSLDGDVPRQRTIRVPPDLYEKAAVGNKVIKEPKKPPSIQLGT